jgi:hypothetical protein
MANTEMKQYELKLASHFMELAADKFANHGCNDLSDEVLSMLTGEEKAVFAQEFSAWNGDPENERTFDQLGDDSVMALLAHKIKQQLNALSGPTPDPETGEK